MESCKVGAGSDAGPFFSQRAQRPMSCHIDCAETGAQIAATCELMPQLRPQPARDGCVARIGAAMAGEDLRLLTLTEDGSVRAGPARRRGMRGAGGAQSRLLPSARPP